MFRNSNGKKKKKGKFECRKVQYRLPQKKKKKKKNKKAEDKMR